MAAINLLKALHVERSVDKNTLLRAYQHNNLIFSRGLKNNQLFKRKTKTKNKKRDGKERTVDHLYWELYFKENPEVLQERAAVNVSKAKAGGAKPMGPSRIYDTLTTADKRYHKRLCIVVFT